MYKAPKNFELTAEQAELIVAELNKDNPGAYFATCSSWYGLNKGGWGVVNNPTDEFELAELMSFENAPVQRYKGINLLLDTAYGYHASNGSTDFGCCELLEDLKAEIDEYFAGDDFGPLNGYFTGEDA